MALVAVYKNPGNYFVSEGGNRYKWEILEEGGTFASTLEAAGRDFIQTSWSMSDKDEYSPFLISETSISVYDNASGELYSDMVSLLSSNQEDKYILRITLVREKGAVSDVNTVKWIGYIKRGQVSKDEDGNAVIKLSATDGIDMLNRKTFSSTATSILGEYEELYTGRVTYTSAMATALDKMGLGLDLYITSSHYPRVSGTQLKATDNPWDNVYVDREGYRQRAKKDGESDRPIKSIDVVKDILSTWGCIMFQWEASWHILQVNKRGDSTVRRWHYDSTGAAQTPAYEDVTAHVITPGTESVERTRGTLSQLPQYDAVRVNFQHGEYKFMPNPGFDIEGNQFFDYDPAGWTIVGPAGGRYENNGNGDGQFISSVVRAIAGDGTLPTTTTGSGVGSVEEFVQDYCDASTGSSDLSTIKIIATSTTNPSGTLTSAAISAYDGNFLPAGTTIFLRDSTQYFTTTLTSRLAPGDTNVFFSPTAGIVLLQDIRAKVGGYAYSVSRVAVAQDQRVAFSLSFLPTANSDDVVARFLNYGSSGGTVYAQIKLTGSSTYYLKKASLGVYEWSTSLEWIPFRITDGDTHSISGFVFEKTPVGGTITTTVGPAIWNALSVLGSPVGYPVDEVRWDNVDVKPILAGNNPNSDSTSTVTYDSAQTTEAARIRDHGVFVGDSPYNPSQFGMSLDSDGLQGTSDWEEAPITGAESNVSHEALLGKVMLRSMRSPRETHASTYFGLESSGVPILASPWHVLSRGGSEYAPMDVSLSWNRDTSDGTWYKVTESGYFDTSNIIKNGTGFTGSRGGVGESTASFFNNIGNSLFADGSAAITRTTATISAGTVTSISVESIAEPIFKTGDLISIMGPDLSFVQARISVDQDALATTLSIEDKDSPGSGVTFAEDMPAPAAVYFLEQELLTLARLGEQGFAVTVLGENLGTINETKSGTYTSLAVTNWGISVKSGAEAYVEQSDDTLVKVTLSADAPKGSTSISFASVSIDVTSGDKVKPAGAVNRADFQVTADAITAYLGNPGDVIATLSADSTWDGTRTTLPCSGGPSEELEANDPILIYTQLGSVVKGIVNADTAVGAGSIVLTAASGNLTASAKSGDKIVPGSVTGLRIDMDGIEVRADELRSSNYAANSAGWLIEGGGNAYFNNISARGSITLTSSSSGVTNFSDFDLANIGGDLDDIPDGGTYAKPLATALSSGQVLLSQAAGSLDNIADGSTYAKVLSTSISAGKILLSQASGDLDDIADGTYGKVLATSISAGKILLAQATGDLDDIADGTYGKVLSTEISAGHIKILGADGTTTVIDGGQIQSASIKTGDIAAGTITGTNISSATKITAGTGNNVGVLDGADATYRIYAGNATPASAPFRVSQTGALTATSATITGGVTATTLTATTAGSIANLTITGDLDFNSYGGNNPSAAKITAAGNILGNVAEFDKLVLYANGTGLNTIEIGTSSVGGPQVGYIKYDSGDLHIDGYKIWNNNNLPFSFSSVASGDVIYYNGTNWVNLAKGTDGQVLTLASGLPSWAAAAGGTGDITAVNTPANSGLDGGATSGSVSLSLDFSNLTAGTLTDLKAGTIAFITSGGNMRNLAASNLLFSADGVTTTINETEIDSPGGGDNDRWRERTLTFTNGILTNVGSWSAYQDIVAGI